MKFPTVSLSISAIQTVVEYDSVHNLSSEAAKLLLADMPQQLSELMASPFKFFRTYSSGMMIVMVILSMLIFTMGDLFSNPGQNLWMLGLLLGGAVFGIAGIGQGKWLQWGIGGAVLGALLGVVLPAFTETGGLSTSLGVIGQDDIEEMQMRRAIANRFLMQATEESFGEGTARFAPLFGFNHQYDTEDVIFGRVMRAEADRLGITVDPTMVKQYLARCTSDKLTKSSYLKIRNGLTYGGRPLSEAMANEILGDEIKARMAWQLTRPQTSTSPTPGQYWEYFRRMNVRQQLNLAGLDVDEFVDQVGEPSDAEVNELFEKYKTKFPNEVERGDPGFRLPGRVQLAYLELNSDTALADMPEITDEDIQTYYDENQESPLIRRPVMPDLEADAASNDTDEASSEKAEGEPKETDETPKATEPKTEAKESTKPAEEAKDVETKTESTEEASTEEVPETTEDGGSCDPFYDEEQATETDEPTTEVVQEATEKTSKAGEDTQAADEPAESSKPALVIPSKDDTPQAPEVPDLPKLEDVEPTAPPVIQYEYRTLDDELKKQIKETIESERLQKYITKKLDAAAAEMGLLARERAKVRFGLIEEDAGSYEVFGDEQQEALKALRDKMRPQEAEWNAQLRAYAKENGLAYAETPMISFNDFIDEDDYPIAKATEPNDNPMVARTPSVAETVFQGFNNDEQNNDAQLYLTRRAQLSSTNLENGQSYYVYWAIDNSITHIPELTEDGVRESVVLAWKTVKARDLVQKRGEELAEIVRKNLASESEEDTGMAVALKDQTVDGTDGGSALAVRVTEPFSWLRTSSASPMSFQQPQATLSTIEFGDANGGFLRKAGNDFMSAVFNDMEDEEVSVVANFDLSKYYVVHVTNRFPTPEVGEDGLRERFATEGQQFGFRQSPILSVMNRDLSETPRISWEKNIWRRYNVNPDEEAVE